MATVLDTLLIELGLNPDKFDEGAKRAVSNMYKLEETAKKGGTVIDEQFTKKLQVGLDLLMRQLERLMGKEALRDGLREYLKKYAYGNATWAATLPYAARLPRPLYEAPARSTSS